MAALDPQRSGPWLALGCCLACAACPAEAPEAAPRSPAEAASEPSATGTVTSTAAGSVTPEPRDVTRIRAEGNHLRDEPSPYLRLHAHDPVDWYPWGAEALERARREGKPIFLSIGYSTCHWCHVMREESFDDDEVAAVLNERFVSIKVDREQRPDIDGIYIDAVAAMGGSTGWPLTVFLTPQLEPFFGGTYYPRHAKGRRPGFLEVLEQVHLQWVQDGPSVARRGQEVLARVEREALAAVGARAPLAGRRLSEAIARLVGARDEQHGGFGGGHKFPQSPLLLAHLRFVQSHDDTSARRHVVRTLEAMMRGGIRDQLAGSFHRYTVDERWHLPHFEKTLYDNAQLAALYVESGLTLGREDFVAVGRAVLDDLLASWQRPDGGLVVGWDADDPGGEGAFYSWTQPELQAVLPADDAAIVQRAFGVDEPGLRSLEGRSVLHREDDEATAAALGLEVEVVRAAIDRSLPLLSQARAGRPAPRVDGKELVAWNALAIMALADVGRWLDEPRYRGAAERAGAWVLDTAWSGARLQRGSIDGQPLGDGFLDDHALAGLAMVRLHAATGDLRWLEGARRLADEIVASFHDAEHHAFLDSRAPAAGDPARLPIRRASFDDGALPSGGAAAVLLMLELGAISGDDALYDLGMATLERIASRAIGRPYASGTVLVALDHATAPVREVVVAGDDDDPTTALLWRELQSARHARVLPVRLPARGLPTALEPAFPALWGKRARQGRATAFVCERGRCEAPTSDPAVLRRQLTVAASGGASGKEPR